MTTPSDREIIMTERNDRVMRSTGPRDRPKRVARGDHVSWDPTGFTVVAARRSSGRGDCLHAVAVNVAGDPPWSSKLVLSQRILCTKLISIVRGEALTYFTRASGAQALGGCGVRVPSRLVSWVSGIRRSSVG